MSLMGRAAGRRLPGVRGRRGGAMRWSCDGCGWGMDLPWLCGVGRLRFDMLGRTGWRVCEVGVVDPVSVIVAALAAGAGAGLRDTASGAVKDAYGGLRELVRRRLVGRPVAEAALVGHEKAPQVWQAPLSAELVAVDAGSDEELVVAAQRLLALVDEAGTRSGKYVVDARGAQGVQVGDHNTQTNTFTTPPVV